LRRRCHWNRLVQAGIPLKGRSGQTNFITT
jgi:hypothetical protein